MTTKDKEATTIQNICDDATQIAVNEVVEAEQKNYNDQEMPSPSFEENKNCHKTLKKAAGFAGAGVILGAASAAFINMNGAEVSELPDAGTDETQDAVILPEVVIQAIIANQDLAINDSMTFEEAFSTAREALGPASAFEWHGKVYATYTNEEWENLSDDEKAAFYDGLNITNPNKSATDGDYQGIESSSQHHAASIETPEEDNDINSGAQNTDHTKQEETIVAQVIDNVNDDQYGNDIEVVSVGNSLLGDGDIQILGVTHDEASGYNVGSINVDGQEVFVIDVDGDMVFDVLASDTNNNGVLDDDEFIDIRQSGLSVNDLGGLSHTNNDMLANGDNPDYLSEMLGDS